MITAGDLVTPSKKIEYLGDKEGLYIWEEIEDRGNSDHVAIAKTGELLLVLQVKRVKFDYPTRYWSRCVQVLTQSRAVGWVGSGWIKKVLPPSAER